MLFYSMYHSKEQSFSFDEITKIGQLLDKLTHYKLTLEASRSSAHTVVTVHPTKSITSVIWSWSLIEASWTHRTHLGSNSSPYLRQTATEYFDVPGLGTMYCNYDMSQNCEITLKCQYSSTYMDTNRSLNS